MTLLQLIIIISFLIIISQRLSCFIKDKKKYVLVAGGLVFFFIFFWHNSCFSFSGNHSYKNIQNPKSYFLDLVFKKGKDKLNKTYYSFECKAKDIFWKNKKINLSLEGNFKKEKKIFIIEITSGSIAFNSSPNENFSSYIVYKNKVLTLTYFKTKGFILKGTIDFSVSPFLDLDVDVKGISLKELNQLWGIKNFPFQGDFRGKIILKGDINNIFIKGTMEAYQGSIEDYKFSKVFLNFRGAYPLIRFLDSYAIIQDINLKIEGIFNLAKLYNLSYNKKINTETTNLDNSKIIEAGREINDVNSLRGFLASSQERDSLIYKLGADSFLKFNFKKTMPSVKPELKF